MRLRLLLENYYLKIIHIAGVENDAVDTLSCLDITERVMSRLNKGQQFNLSFVMTRAN